MDTRGDLKRVVDGAIAHLHLMATRRPLSPTETYLMRKYEDIRADIDAGEAPTDALVGRMEVVAATADALEAGVRVVDNAQQGELWPTAGHTTK